MVLGFLPFEGETIHALSLLVRVKEPVYPSYLSEELRSLLQSLLNKDPEKRPTLEQIKNSPWMANSRPRSASASSSARASPRLENTSKTLSKCSAGRSQPNLSDIIVERLVATGRFTVQPKDNSESPKESSRDSSFLKIAPRPRKLSASPAPNKEQFQSDDPKAKLIKRRKKISSREFQLRNERRKSIPIESLPQDSL